MIILNVSGMIILKQLFGQILFPGGRGLLVICVEENVLMMVRDKLLPTYASIATQNM